MRNGNGKTTEEQAVEHTGKGLLKQVQGNIKEAWGSLTGDTSTKLEGKVDRLKGRIQEDYGRTKADQAELERKMRDLDDTARKFR